MTNQFIKFDIRSLRGEGFNQVFPLLAASVMALDAPAQERRNWTEVSSVNGFQSSKNDSEVAAEIGFQNRFVNLNALKNAWSELDGMRGQAQVTTMRVAAFSDLIQRWERRLDRKAERQFRILAAVLSCIEDLRPFAPVRRDEIRFCSAGYVAPGDYDNFGRGERLLTDMQIRVTLDELQAQDHFTSVVYGNRHRYFSASLAQDELAEQIRELHGKKFARKAIKIKGIRREADG